MKIRLLLLFLVSCAHKPDKCVLVESATYYGTTINRYTCGDYEKYCKYDRNKNEIGCFGREK